MLISIVETRRRNRPTEKMKKKHCRSLSTIGTLVISAMTVAERREKATKCLGVEVLALTDDLQESALLFLRKSTLLLVHEL